MAKTREHLIRPEFGSHGAVTAHGRARWLAVCVAAWACTLAQGQTPLSGTLVNSFYYASPTLSNCTGTSPLAGCSTATLGANANVTLEAATQIVLGPGFTAIGSATSSLVAKIGVPPAPADFSLSISSGTATVLAGSTASFTITVAALNGFAGAVSFAPPSGLPSGATATFSQPTITGSGSTTLTIRYLANAGTSSLTVTAASGSLSHAINATVIVQDFSLSISSPTAYVTGVNPAKFVVTATSLNGFSSPVTLALTAPGAMGSSITYSCSIALTFASSCDTALVAFAVQPGVTQVQAAVQGGSGGLWHSVPATVNVTGGAAQTISFSAPPSRAFGTAPFTIIATASSGLQVSFMSLTSSVCTVSGAIATLVGAGTCTIQASQAGNVSYAQAPPVPQSFLVTPGAQTITFVTPPPQVLGATPPPLSATATSGLTVSFSPLTSSVCTVLGTTVTLVAVGTCTIQAAQGGNANYAAAPPVSQSFAVTPPGNQSQTITFNPLSNQVFGAAPFPIAATASSNLPVSFTSTTSAVCTVSAGATVTLVAAGTCTINATQRGNLTYAAATTVPRSFTVAQAAQTIAFGSLSNQVLGATPPPLNATATSGLTVTFASTNSAICTVSGTTVTLVAVGTCTINATQLGNANYLAATPVPQSFAVTQPGNQSQTITFNPLSDQVFGAAPFTIGATASSGLPVSFTSTTLAVCTVPVATVTLVAAGTCAINATQAGNASYAAATPVSRTFQVTAPAAPTITSLSTPTGPVGSSLTIYGTNLGSAGSVTIGGAPATAKSWTSTSITVAVPTLAPGPASVVVTVGGTSATAPSQFTVTPAVKEYIHLGGRVIAIENN